MQGIDVSKWNGIIDFEAVANYGILFVIIRAGYGKEPGQIDPSFERNYANAKKAGLLVGAYWYSYAESMEDARKEARACYEAIRGKSFELPIYYDVEEKRQFDRGRVFCDGIISTFCDLIAEYGYKPGLYMSTSPLTAYVSENIKNKYTVWVAQYGPKCTYSGKYNIWQYSSKGVIPGVCGFVDVDEMYSLDDVQEPEPEPVSEAIQLLAKEVIAGKWGNGKDRKENIYKAVQAEVNKILGA